MARPERPLRVEPCRSTSVPRMAGIGTTAVANFRNRIPPPRACRNKRSAFHLRLRADCARKRRLGNPKNCAQFPRGPRISRDPPWRSDFPRTWLFVGRGGFRLAEPAVEFFELCGAVALAGKLAVETAVEHRLDADHEDDARYLDLDREVERIEPFERPGQDGGHLVERHIEQPFELLGLRQRTPCGIREAGAEVV